ncbi:right-handed parallel beta-helix repeat-containing protein [Candidatus Woesearchaeota archaeon]|nr:right-handed parallel beta-helix repeat-containing protein [Candidatus Woesearchaeota archaeon]
MFIFLLPLVAADECGSIPTDHCTISQDTTFTNGVYTVQNLSIISNSTTLDCNGATLIDKNSGYYTLLRVGGTKDVVIKNCHFQIYGAAISNEHFPFIPGIRNPPVEHITIRDNIFSNSGNWAIRFDNKPPTVSNTTVFQEGNHEIMNNTIVGSYRGMALLHGNDNSKILDNNISINGDYGIQLAGSSNNVIEGNVVEATAQVTPGTVYVLRDAGRDATNTTIRLNKIQTSYRAINLEQGSDDALVEFNQIEDVDLGILVLGKNAVIRRNVFGAVFRDSNTAGIQLDTTAENTTVFLNIFEKTTDPAGDTGFNNRWNGVITIFGNNYTFGNFYDIFYKDEHCRYGYCCVDKNFDNICDNPFVIPTNNMDRYAMRSKSTPSGTPPWADPIPDINVNEVDTVHVTINGHPGSNETLFYSIKNQLGQVDPRFVQDPVRQNEFDWQTGFKDGGQYTFKAVVTDGENLNGGVNFKVIINESDPDCRLYLPRIASGCEVKSDITFFPGTYLVPDGISVVADNVKVDCNGAVMDNQDAGTVVGITVQGRSNVNILNCEARNNYRGLVIDNSNNIHVRQSTFVNSSTGILATNSNNLHIEENIIPGIGLSYDQIGIIFDGVQDSLLLKNHIIDNENGQIRILNSPRNNVTENNISSYFGITPRPISVGGSYAVDNVIYRNNFIYFPIGANGHPSDSGTNTQWTVNNEGNYWHPHAINWPSTRQSLCINNNWDRICDNPFAILFNKQDSYPFARVDGWKKPYPQITLTGTPRIGQQITIQLKDEDMAGKDYFVVADFITGSGIPLGDGRILDLAGTGLFYISLFYPQLLGLVNYAGTFDQQGVATIPWNIPNYQELVGLPFRFNVAPFDPAKQLPQAILTTYKSPSVVVQA